MAGESGAAIVQGWRLWREQRDANWRQGSRATPDQARVRGRAAMRGAKAMMMRPGGRGLVVANGPFRAERSSSRIEGGGRGGADEKSLQHERIDGQGREAQPQRASHVSCPLAHQDVKTSKGARVKPRAFTAWRVTFGAIENDRAARVHRGME
jgi:hypothetical protein